MSVFVGGFTDLGLSSQNQNGTRIYDANLSVSLGTPPQWQTETLAGGDFLVALQEVTPSGRIVKRSEFAALLPDPTAHLGFLQALPQDTWFEQIIVIPRSFHLGNILTALVFEVDIYSSYRFEDRIFQTFNNFAGVGVEITDLPSLPTALDPQSGFVLTLEISPDGPPLIDGTLEFVFDTETVVIPITGSRTTIFAYEPEIPMQERLFFATDVRRHRMGTEQRARLRHTPRQHFDLQVRLDGRERRQAEAILFGRQGSAYGVPVWFEATYLTADIAVSDLTISVESTAFADYRVDGLAMVFAGAQDFEALQIESFDSATITFATPFTKTFSAGARVMPVRIGSVLQLVRGKKFPLNLEDLFLTFTIEDNEADLSSTAAFSSFNSKVLLDGGNFIDRSLEETYERPVTVIDNVTGQYFAVAEWNTNRRGSPKTFLTRTREELWNVRQLLHALGGRATSFYLPTFFPEFEAIDPIASGSSLLTVVNQGYARDVQALPPRNVVRLVAVDGTTVIRTVLSAAEVDADSETLTLDAAWGVDVALDEIDYIDFVEEVRFDTDEILIDHLSGRGNARAVIPVTTVLS